MQTIFFSMLCAEDLGDLDVFSRTYGHSRLLQSQTRLQELDESNTKWLARLFLGRPRWEDIIIARSSCNQIIGYLRYRVPSSRLFGGQQYEVVDLVLSPLIDPDLWNDAEERLKRASIEACEL
jgi:hypothetical protein